MCYLSGLKWSLAQTVTRNWVYEEGKFSATIVTETERGLSCKREREREKERERERSENCQKQNREAYLHAVSRREDCLVVPDNATAKVSSSLLTGTSNGSHKGPSSFLACLTANDSSFLACFLVDIGIIGNGVDASQTDDYDAATKDT